MATTSEDIAAENILKRAELARISRQLKTRLSQTNLKARLKGKAQQESQHSGKATLPSSLTSTRPKQQESSTFSLMPAPETGAALNQTSPQLLKKRSLESIDGNRTEDESESPLKRTNVQHYPPSSPLYEEISLAVPKTPPQQKISLNTDIYNTASTNKTQLHFSSPAQPLPAAGTSSASSTLQRAVLSTPKQPRDEGADLLMFLATSPSPVQYKNNSGINIPSTPSRSIKNSLSAASSQVRSSTSNALQSNNIANTTAHANTTNINAALGLTPGTPKNRFLKTPGFNMNDYVNLFTPSPAIQRTPGDLSKDVNGKLIKF